MVWLDDQAIGRNMIGKLVTKEFIEIDIRIGLSEWANTMKIFGPPVNAHQRVTSSVESFNNQVDRMISL
jgi:hypothetical protein